MCGAFYGDHRRRIDTVDIIRVNVQGLDAGIPDWLRSGSTGCSTPGKVPHHPLGDLTHQLPVFGVRLLRWERIEDGGPRSRIACGNPPDLECIHPWPDSTDLSVYNDERSGVTELKRDLGRPSPGVLRHSATCLSVASGDDLRRHRGLLPDHARTKSFTEVLEGAVTW